MELLKGKDYNDIDEGSLKYQLLRQQSYKTSFRGESVHTKYIHLYEDGELVVAKGYKWDGASGGIDTKSFMRGSLIHDALCDCYQFKWLPTTHETRLKSDKELYKICREDGMNWLRAKIVYFFVRRYSRIRYGRK